MVAIKVGSLFVTVEPEPGGLSAQWRVYEDVAGQFGRLLAGGKAMRLEVIGGSDASGCLQDALQNGVAEARRRQEDEGLPMMAWEDVVFGWAGREC
jgi:hypothetical protein